MNPLLQLIAPISGFIFVGLAGIAAVVVGTVIGGFRCGELRRTLQFKVERNALDTTWGQMHQRLSELGFIPAVGESDRYLQSGEAFGDPGSFTHAKTKKEMLVNFQDTGSEVTATLSLRYLTFIVYDSGESAYRDAVLNYVSGQADRMLVVPNRSLLAMNSLMGGVIAVPAGALVMISGFTEFRQGVLVLSITEIAVGLLGLFFILLKPREIAGKWLAIIGIVLSAAGLALSYVR